MKNSWANCNRSSRSTPNCRRPTKKSSARNADENSLLYALPQ
jgi:hypothetical protein